MEEEQYIGSKNWVGRFSIEEQIRILTLDLDFLYRGGWLQLQLTAKTQHIRGFGSEIPKMTEKPN